MKIRFAPIKGDPDKTTLILKGTTEILGYYDYSWARYGGTQYRYKNLHATTRKEIERLITSDKLFISFIANH
jgi:hypothetical protein